MPTLTPLDSNRFAHTVLPKLQPGTTTPPSEEATASLYPANKAWPPGLCTPPTDDMSVCARASGSFSSTPNGAGYAYGGLVALPERAMNIKSEPRYAGDYAGEWAGEYAKNSSRSSDGLVLPPILPSQATSRSPSPELAPVKREPGVTVKSPSPAPSMSSLAVHDMQIPRILSTHGGNMADFAAEMACFFWFESNESLEEASHFRTRRSVRPLINFSEPTALFRNWVLQVLSTTQVTQSVIVLALMYIYRLKQQNPAVRGLPGSEYRLMTVALLLANKFLDDNTYTNKTWSDVSSISVEEIHRMEVEFLSNSRYSLLARQEDWDDWVERLRVFCDYYHVAMGRASLPQALPPIRTLSRSPIKRGSPPVSHRSAPHRLPMVEPVFMPASPSRQQNWSPQRPMPMRKRSFVEEMVEQPPAKRLSIAGPNGILPMPETRRPFPPALSLNTAAAAAAPESYSALPPSPALPLLRRTQPLVFEGELPKLEVPRW